MYKRFTDRARKVMQLANQEAQRFDHEYIGTEHLLLGLVAEGAGVGANVLKNLEIDLDRVREEVLEIVQSGPYMVTGGKLPLTPRIKNVIEYAMAEAIGLKHNYVGTEHLLLGLLREEESVAAQVLMNLGLELKQVRKEVARLLGGSDRESWDAGVASMVTDFRDMGALEYTHRARKVMLLAAEEAYNFGHTYLGPEHILLAIYQAETGVSLDILKAAGLGESEVRNELEKLLQAGDASRRQLDFDQSPQAVFALTESKVEAMSLNSDVVDADHLLLGLLHETEGIVARLLRIFHVNRAELREQIRSRLKAEKD